MVGMKRASALLAAANEKFTFAPHWWQRVALAPTSVPQDGQSFGRGLALFPKISNTPFEIGPLTGSHGNTRRGRLLPCRNANALPIIPENERENETRHRGVRVIFRRTGFGRVSRSKHTHLGAITAGIALFVIGGCSHHNQTAQAPAPTPIPSAPNSPSPPRYPNAPPSGPPPPIERQPATPGEYVEEGVASWYGPQFNGRRTSNGEVYDMHDFTAAHRTLPFGTLLRVTNLSNGLQTEVRVNDRGPFVSNRIIDLSLSAAKAIQMVGPGTAQVRLEVISGPNQESGSFGVQVGAFLVKDNAEKFRDRLAARYPSVSIVPYDSPDGFFYRVRVGRVPTEEQAQQLAAQLQANDQLTTFVVRLDN